MIRWVLTAGAMVLFATAGLAYATKQHEVTFRHLHDAHARLLDAGFHCTADRPDGMLSMGFLISRQAASWSEAGSLRKSGPMGPEWKGKVWLTFTSNDFRLVSLPDQAGTRVWGMVVAYGDEQLLSEIEDALAPASFFLP